jgi:hypothetical protein
VKNNKPIYTKARACTILPNHVGVEFHVHNGKDYIPVKVTEDMVGHKLGEFAQTRKKFSYRSVLCTLGLLYSSPSTLACHSRDYWGWLLIPQCDEKQIRTNGRERENWPEQTETIRAVLYTLHAYPIPLEVEGRRGGGLSRAKRALRRVKSQGPIRTVNH